MSNQTPIQKKIEELKEKFFTIEDFDNLMLALAQYIKGEVVPEEIPLTQEELDSPDYQYDYGQNYCRSQVVDKFKELGI